MDRAATVVVGFALRAESHGTGYECEEGVVFAHTDVFAGHDLGAALTYDDFTNSYLLTIRALNAEVLWIRIVEVFGRPSGFCMCHTVRMNIAELQGQIKGRLDRYLGDYGLFGLIFALVLLSFGLGRLSALEEVKPPISIIHAAKMDAPEGMYLGGQFVAARGGTVYYYPWCGGAEKIAPGSQVWFATEAAAQKAGFRPAKNCKGLTN